MENIKTYILEKLKVTKSSGYKMTLKEFAKERQSLNTPGNNLKLTSKDNDKRIFIKWVEKMLVDDGVVDEIPIRGHILYFDGDILRDNIGHNEVDPPVSTEMYLTWGEAYMNVVTYYIKNGIFSNPGIVTEKLRVTKKSYEDITFEKFINEFQKMNNPTIYFDRHLELIGGDYPTFSSYPGMSNTYNACVGKKFKNMYLVRSKGQIQVHLDFKRSIGNITSIVITNTDELYNYLGDDQVSMLYDLIKDIVDVQWI